MPAELDLGLLGASGFKITGAEPFDEAGYSVSAAGDINGDGFADIIIGAPFRDQNGDNRGATYVIFGRQEGFGAIDLGNLSAGVGFAILGGKPNDFAGFSASAAGDVNKDGFDDLIIGAPGGDEAGFDGGQAYIVFGKASGFGTVDLGTLTSSAGFMIQADNAFDRAGQSVSGLGDINGDGFDDFAVTAPRGNGGGGWYYYDFSTPTAYVVLGSASTTDLNLTFFDSSDGFRIDSPGSYGIDNLSIAGAGDVNGDGLDDIIVGDLRANDYFGAAYVIFGKASGFGTIQLPNLPSSSGFVILGDDGQDWAGSFVSSAGDMNGDGYDDVIVGASNADLGARNGGATYVVFGKAGGFGTLDLTNLSASNGFAIYGAAAGDQLMFSSPIGDINGDGYGDIVIGAQGAGADQSGAAYVIFGRASGFGTIDLKHLDMRSGFALVGEMANDGAGRVSGIGDFNKDGYDDLIVGAPFSGSGGELSGAAYVIFGREAFVANSVQLNGDFNGDNLDDILWRSDGGRMTNWLGQANGSFAGNFANADANVGADWSVVGVGDFNGDGRDDVVWRNSNGDLFNWLSQVGGGFASNANNSYVHLDPSWQVIGTGDFNGDNRSDLLLRNDAGRVTNWLGQANGSFLSNFANADANAGLNWHVAGVGDFNGDNRDDILWRNANGDIFTWLGQVGGRFLSNAANSYSDVSTSWQIVGIGDFNGDTRSDILWRDDGGRVTNWLGQMNGSFASNFANADATAGLDWYIVGTGDYNGDNRSDVLWRSTGGDVTTWQGQMNGGFVNSTNGALSVDNSWHVQVSELGWI